MGRWLTRGSRAPGGFNWRACVPSLRKKKRSPKVTPSALLDKNGKGLRQFSLRVSKKVEEKGCTTYNEVTSGPTSQSTAAAMALTWRGTGMYGVPFPRSYRWPRSSSARCRARAAPRR